MFHRSLCICILLLTFAVSSVRLHGQDEATKWTNPDGKEIAGQFVRLDGKTLVLLLDNGKEVKVPLSSLSLESHLKALKLAKPDAFTKELVKAPVAVQPAALSFKITPESVLISPFQDDPKIDSFMRTFVDEVNRGNLFVAWHMMPPRMQTDMSSFISRSLMGMGPGVPNQMKKLFSTLTNIAATKKDWLLDASVTQHQMTAEQVEATSQGWPYIVAMLTDLSDENIWNSQNFRQENIPNFLASILVSFQYMAQMEKKQNLDYKVVSETADRAEVRLIMDGNESPSVNFQKVGKIWVVPELMNPIRKFLDENANAQPNPQQVMGPAIVLATVLPVLNKLDQAKTKEEFRQVLQTIQGQFKPPAIPGAAGGGIPGFPGF